MKKLVCCTLLMLMSFSTLIACGGNGAQEIYDTAKLEEIQNNPEHALSLYQELVDQYPSSPLAEKAQERIKALSKQTQE